MSQLYLVPTPIGNLGDMTFRAVEVLKSVDLILAEDTRTSGKLLKHYEIETPSTAFHAHNEHKRVEHFAKEIERGISIALISDAGTPGISDPGFLLARECHKSGLRVEALPGPTAFVPALVASGLPCDKFYFEGFLPHKKGKQTRLEFISSLPCTVVLYESPHRIVKTLGQLAEHYGENHQACVARELSKLHEEVRTESLAELKNHFETTPPKGEFVVVIGAK
ncbi:MAG: 16S rRNA (cytidine1402-2'-O)-methyltransferase [Granulosicoccus sp.]|jgi:16S rRNA (cytidine1402-2'-O)-methyltransferase